MQTFRPILTFTVVCELPDSDFQDLTEEKAVAYAQTLYAVQDALKALEMGRFPDGCDGLYDLEIVNFEKTVTVVDVGE